jgi:hypothetical protein
MWRTRRTAWFRPVWEDFADESETPPPPLPFCRSFRLPAFSATADGRGPAAAELKKLWPAGRWRQRSLARLDARRAEQPTLFELHEDHRPAGERNAAEQYCEPGCLHRGMASRTSGNTVSTLAIADALLLKRNNAVRMTLRP